MLTDDGARLVDDPARCLAQALGEESLVPPSAIKGGTVKHLFETLCLRQVGYRDWITVRAQDAAEAIFFNLSWAAASEYFRHTGPPSPKRAHLCSLQ